MDYNEVIAVECVDKRQLYEYNFYIGGIGERCKK